MPTRRTLLAAAPALLATRALAQAAPPVVTLFGDSLFAGYGLPQEAGMTALLQGALTAANTPAMVRNAGMPGETSAGGLARLNNAVKPDTRLCLVEFGLNDTRQHFPLDVTRKSLTSIVQRLKGKGIAVILVGSKSLAEGPGYDADAYASLFAALADTEHVPLFPDILQGVSDHPELKQADGIHPNADGEKLIVARLAPVVAEALKALPPPAAG